MAGGQGYHAPQNRAQLFADPPGGEIVRPAGDHHLRHTMSFRQFQKQAAGFQGVAVSPIGRGYGIPDVSRIIEGFAEPNTEITAAHLLPVGTADNGKAIGWHAAEFRR